MTSIRDIVICGPDMSGTSSQLKDIISYLQNKGLTVRDMRGTEADALFHAERFAHMNNYLSLQDFLSDSHANEKMKKRFYRDEYRLLSGYQLDGDLKIASMVRNDISTYVNPNSADAWIFEEPTRRGAGQVNRAFEQNRLSYNATPNPIAESMSHQGYRSEEFFRFRGPIRQAQVENETGKPTIFRSRSEESACYQIFDKVALPNGIPRNQYLALPGHEVAFGNPPTHIFVVCGPEDWPVDDYEAFRTKRTGNRVLDDYEKDTPRQLMVNRRYASNWINELYEDACAMYGSDVPEIIRFDIMNSKEDIRNAMYKTLDRIF